jgi:hypothetical protein
MGSGVEDMARHWSVRARLLQAYSEAALKSQNAPRHGQLRRRGSAWPMVLQAHREAPPPQSRTTAPWLSVRPKAAPSYQPFRGVERRLTLMHLTISG